MIAEGPDGFVVKAVYLPARVSPHDPLAQRGYLAIKIFGGLSAVVYDNPDDAVQQELLDKIANRCAAALREAVASPEQP